ncbi:hypothetical protein SAMN06297387_12363 [Streptomyces zhaozhouensis]|uniref:Uncharacterized protein n=1 Tax=Streptomyces zhaozhouensis TaxID=1300267 RepID=A0A286E4L2_9ACTN|nr:hypothetical protein [Streptomyces zhaozhouensis]SOD65814.1 hypothetical protein SAMN06297387_12363 [Streptomyces zhaozhouensis]
MHHAPTYQRPRPAPAPPAPPSDRPSGTLLGETLWRVLIVVCAVLGYRATEGGTLLALSQLASVAAAVGYSAVVVATLTAAALRRPEPPTAWLRGLLSVSLLVVMTTWFTAMGGGIDETWSFFEHLLTPLAALVDWLCVGRRQRNARWWYPLTWAGALLAYLVVYLFSDVAIYPFLDPSDPTFLPALATLAATTLALGYVLVATARATGAPPASRAPAPA